MGSANLWVLDFLLEADGLDDTLIKHFHDVNANQFEELPPNTQARLMLRVLRDAPAQPTGIAEAALGALNMLKNLAEQMPENFAPNANLEALKPSPLLFTEVKTELVLKSLRDGNQGEHPRVILDTFFVPPEQGGLLDPLERDRRNEILEGLKGPEQAQELLARYPVAQLNHALLSFVANARAAMGPNMLKLVEKDILEGRYNPHSSAQAQAVAQAGAAAKRRRTKAATTTEEDAAGMLANMSQSNAVLAAAGGQDPLTGAMQSQDVKPPGEQGHHMNNPGEGTPMQGALTVVGTPIDGNAAAPSPADSQGRQTKPGQPPRRRNGRWNEEETAFLIRNVRDLGKGKWKRILESGGSIFQNRSQVDLKDKWRNLERQGVVGPQDLPPQPVPQGLSGQVQSMGQQLVPESHLMAQTMLNHDGQPLTEAQAQHYAAFAAQYAAQLAANQQQHISPELLQQHMQQMQQMAPQAMQPLPPHMLPPEQALPQAQQQEQHPGHQPLEMQPEEHVQEHQQHQQHQQQLQHQLQNQQAAQLAEHAQVQATVPSSMMPPKLEEEDKKPIQM